MKIIRKSLNEEGDIDCLVSSLQNSKLNFLDKGFFYAPYLGKETGFFMKKLTIDGLITYHIQDKIFFIYKTRLIVIEGFENLILNSEKNYDYMLYIMKIFYENKIKKRYIIYIENHYQVPLNQINLSQEIALFIKENKLKVVESNIKHRYWLKKIKRLKFFFYPRFIAITGLDGSGKSTIVSELTKIMQNNSRVVYMGKKDWQIKLAQDFLIVKKLPSIFNILILYFEFYYRFLNTFKNTKLILFDRYPSEMYLTQTGIRKIIYYIMFNKLFPNIRKTFYLHCSVDLALGRKDDIDDVVDFKRRKGYFDKHYINSVWINTEDNNVTETLEIILNSIDPKTFEIL